MKTIYALFSSAIATVAICLMALILTACSNQTLPPVEAITEATPVVPTTLVYSVEAPDGFDRDAIAYAKPSSDGSTYKIEGHETTISLSEAFAEVEDEDFFATDLTPDNDIVYSSEISVLKAVTCHAVEGRNPIDESSFFEAGNGKVWLYSQVALPERTTGLIQHIWKHNGEEKHRVVLMVEGPTFRTASYKTMNETLAGDWTVEVATENGEVLDMVSFEVL
jgi:hypothetical protein